MIFIIAFRNVNRNKRRFLPLAISIAVTSALLFISNSFLEKINSSFESAYRTNITGDLTIAPGSSAGFTLFGSEAVLIGNFLIQPVLDDGDAILDIIRNSPLAANAAGQVSSLAKVDIAGTSQNQALFGVDFGSYTEMFPGLSVISGAFPPDGSSGILLNLSRYESIYSQNGSYPAIGTPVLVMAPLGNTFVIREVPFCGVFEYPIEDEAINRIALIDVDTARGLNGYVYAAEIIPDLPVGQTGLITSDIDDLFGEEGGIITGTDNGIDLSEIDELFVSGPSVGELQQTVRGAWNYILVRLSDGKDIGDFKKFLAETYGGDYLVRDWRRSIGGNALLVSYIQLTVNGGLFFVAFGALIIVINALVLSILERQREIGTMRALGISRFRLSVMICFETIFIVAGSAVIGIAAGCAGVLAINAIHIPLKNVFLNTLWGGGTMQGSVSIKTLGLYCLIIVSVVCASVVYPLKKTLGISPLCAMAGH
ncbi:MAG: ABC transporter permease [Candidatus Latescibacteria bacterium]|nr:ABC transporter permease [Candidatus Latescibacterota bacterium]